MRCLRSLIFTVTIVFIIGCDPHDGKLTIVNNTNDTIFYSLSLDNAELSYPINEVYGTTNYQASNFVQPRSENHELVMGTWEYFINNKCRDSILTVFFFRKDLIETAGKDSIVKYQLSSKKIEFQVVDLEKTSWIVSYDGE